MLNPSFFDRIESLSGPVRSRLEQIPVVERCLNGDVEMETYISFLTEAYHHVSHTVPLLMACGARLPSRLEWLREAVAHYIEEELGHQEWILDDLENLSVPRQEVISAAPSMATELMLSYAYDTIARGNPVGFFGMVYTLEKTSSTIATFAAQQIATKLDLGPQAMSYMISHGSLDVEHLQQFEALMNRLDDESDQQAVIHTIPVFYALYSNIFESLPLPAGDSLEVTHAA